MTDKDQQTDGDGLSRRRFVQTTGSAALLSGVAKAAPSKETTTAGARNNQVDTIVALSAAALSAAIAQRTVSCVEVMQAYLRHINQHNPAVNAIVSLRSEEQLLAQAQERDAELSAGHSRGWLHGVPHAVKDLADAKGLPTTMGSPIFVNQIATQDAIHVERIRKAGAIVIGKTNVPEFGLGSQTYNPVFGPTRNAYDHSRTAGGSSGGAAVGLALQLLPVADGSDFMGSLRNPAGFNNVIGFRPTPGRVPLSDRFIEELPCNGPMGRTVTDTALLLSTMAGYDRRSPTSLNEDPAQFERPLARDWKNTRIGWLGDFKGYLAMEPEALALCERALGGFRAIGCSVDSALPAYSMPQLWRTWLTLRHWLSRDRSRALYEDPKTRALMKPEAIWEAEGGAGLSADAVAQASQARGEWYQALLTLFERFDFLVLPTAQLFPFDVDTHWPEQIGARPMDTYHRWMEVVIPGTLSGCPVINVPAGFSKAGLPMGLQIISKRYADFAALQLAYGYEQATRWNLDHQPSALNGPA